VELLEADQLGHTVEEGGGGEANYGAADFSIILSLRMRINAAAKEHVLTQ
jgi:hypothetical protein